MGGSFYEAYIFLLRRKIAEGKLLRPAGSWGVLPAQVARTRSVLGVWGRCVFAISSNVFRGLGSMEEEEG